VSTVRNASLIGCVELRTKGGTPFSQARMVTVGTSNLLIGFNDLSSLMLGRERGGDELKLHRAMWWGRKLRG
jgi:hypothetical protein